MDNYIVTPANNSTNFDIPVFRSLPSIIDNNVDDYIINQKITKIDIQNIQDEEPFKNYRFRSKSKYRSKYSLLFAFFIIFMIPIFITIFTMRKSFTRKK